MTDLVIVTERKGGKLKIRPFEVYKRPVSKKQDKKYSEEFLRCLEELYKREKR